jgi:hyaluronan synthase
MKLLGPKVPWGGVRLVAFEVNKGKREAMAIGIEKALYPIVIFVDSDSFIAPDGIRIIAEHFLANEQVAAVSGNTKVENAGKNLMTKMQSIKYAISFDIYKASESVHHSVSCCPGCFSAYRKSAIDPLIHEWMNHKFLGSKSTFGDDRGLTNFVLRSGWKIVYCEKAKATTTVPENFFIYWKQQLRWKKSWIREGIFAGTFMWKERHPLASFGFYISFSFPFLVIVLTIRMLFQVINSGNPLLLLVFVFGFLLLGTVYALFVRVYFGARYWFYMPLFSLLYISIFI